MPSLTRRAIITAPLMVLPLKAAPLFTGRRGIALYPWFSETHNIVRPKPTLGDLMRLNTVGFDHVRIPIDPMTIDLYAIERGVEMCLKANLQVILNLHPRMTLNLMAELRRYTDIVTALARRFKHHTVAFEPMNEPQFPVGSALFDKIQTDFHQIIRAEAKSQTIILTGPEGSLIHGLEHFNPSVIKDDNTLFTFHYYEPFAFTHQGASWVNEPVKSTRNLPYISNPQVIKDHFGVVDRWAKRYNISNNRLYLGEFGVVKPYSLPEHQYLWIKEVREAADHYAMPWCFWNMFEVMSLVKNSITRDFDEGFIAALMGGRHK